MTQPQRKLVTYDEYAAMPDDGKRYELLEGRLEVVPSPNTEHQRILLRLARWLADYVERHGLGEVFIAPYDVILSLHNAPQPDIVFVSSQNAGRVSKRGVEGPPDLAIEILSPSSKSRDWVRKQRVYAAAGIPEYWVVDPEAKTISVLLLEAEGYEPREDASGEAVVPSKVLPGLPIKAKDVFGE